MRLTEDVLPTVFAGVWIVLSEFFRNQLLLNKEWVSHFGTLGLRFVTTPLNGMLWVLWSFVLAYVIFVLQKKFSFWETVTLSWISAFALMWITIFNLQVMPPTLLWIAVPLSFVEIFVALLIIQSPRSWKR
jgi:hypothetical protein